MRESSSYLLRLSIIIATVVSKQGKRAGERSDVRRSRAFHGQFSPPLSWVGGSGLPKLQRCLCQCMFHPQLISFHFN
jgi:hypothetical protein